MKTQEIYNQILCKVSGKYGAPMGRISAGPTPDTETRVFDRIVHLNAGGYDKGGAYWGIGETLRVRFTADRSFVEFYRGRKKAHLDEFPKSKRMPY